MDDTYEQLAVTWYPNLWCRLHGFGLSWMGWCSDDGVRADPALRDKTRALRPSLPPAITRRGLYGNLRSPFRLADGRNRWALAWVLEEISRKTPEIVLPPLEPVVRGDAVVLAPRQVPAALTDLIGQIADAVRLSQSVPAPARPTLASAAARRKVTGTSAESFYVPLTGSMRPGDAEAFARRFAREYAPLLQRRITLRDIALMGDPGDGRPWRLVERFRLADWPQLREGHALEVIG